VLIGVGPRTIGRQHPYRTGLYTAWLVRALGLILGPLSRLLILLGNAITPGKGYREGPFSTDVEFREMVDLAQARGVVDDDEREMIHSVFDLGDTIAREIMVPRPEVVWIESTKTIRQAVALSLRTGFTRLPVVGESVDDVLGIVNLKDMIRREMYGERAAKSETVLDVLVPASFIPDSKRLDDLLSEMQAEHTHLAIVVDEYGGTAGIVTIEDVLEEIVGEITDESDTDEQAPIEEITPGTWRVSARVSIEDLAEEVDREIRFDENEVETVAGLMAQRLGKVPLPGTELDVAGLRLVAEGGKDRRGRLRITTVLVSRLAKEEEDEDEDAGD
jgi:CBS domain containing-hemolysin-like protein